MTDCKTLTKKRHANETLSATDAFKLISTFCLQWTLTGKEILRLLKVDQYASRAIEFLSR